MEIISALLALCAGNSLITGEFPSQRPVTRSFDVFFDLRLNKQLRKQLSGWWIETPLRSFLRHCNGVMFLSSLIHSRCQCAWQGSMDDCDDIYSGGCWCKLPGKTLTARNRCSNLNWVQDETVKHKAWALYMTSWHENALCITRPLCG